MEKSPQYEREGDTMKIRIMSREALERRAREPWPEGTAVISITDADDTFAALHCAPMALLQVAFDDVDNDVLADELHLALGQMPDEAARREVEEKYRMLSDEQAAQIAAFYADVRERATLLVCQCEHGQSRSAAVAAAILEHRDRRGITVFADDRYYPNKVVFRKVLAALRCCEILRYDAKK
jgi:predicted protein tyrosine phosphatase